MKILFFIETLRSGGKERRMLELIKYLCNNTNFDIKIILLYNEIHYKYVFNFNVSIEVLCREKTQKNYLFIAYKYFKICNIFRPDIIHTWGLINTIYSILPKYILKIPIVNSMITNTYKIKKFKIVIKILYIISMKISNILLINSIAAVQSYNLKKKYKIIYNGIDLDRFNNKNINNTLNIKFKEKKNIITMVASVNKNKNYDMFINIAKYFINKNNIIFIGVGDGEEMENIRLRIINEKINNVYMIGKVNNIEEILNESDICILLSPSEGISNSILEYMAAKKPVIASKYGGTKEIIEDCKNGFLVDNKEYNIVNKISYLIDNKNIRIDMGEIGYQIVKEKFNSSINYPKFIYVYKSIIKG